MRKFTNAIRKSFAPLGGQSTLRRNFLVVARANILALALPVLAMPFLARIFDPSAFALLGVYLAAIGIVTAFSTARMDWAIPNARTDLMAASLFSIGAAVLLVVTILCVLFVVVLTTFPEISPRVFELGWTIWIAPLIVVATGNRALLHGWLVRTGALGAVARSTIVQTISNVALSFATGLAGLTTTGLIVAYAAASWAGISILAGTAGRRFRRALGRVTLPAVVAALGKHGRQALWSTGVSILNACALSTPIIVLGALYSPQEVGWFFFMQRMIAAPLGAMSSALGQSFWSHAAKLALERNMQELSNVYRAVTLRLALASIPLVIICLSGPLFVGILLGEKWSGAGYVLAALTPLFVASLLFSPTNHLVVLHKQHLQLYVDALRIGLMLVGILTSYVFELGFVMAVVLMSFAAFLGHAAIYIIQIREHAK
ncbi:MAG: lipopolysaccharide biosynthesis protein [Beijerinckiaceae bacterium]